MAEDYVLVHPSDAYADQIRNYREIFLKKHQSLDGTSDPEAKRAFNQITQV